MMENTLQPVDNFFLALADDELMVGHVLTAVAGWGPELEANLALSSIGQDELGHAEFFYSRLEPTEAGRNQLVYDRPAEAFRSSRLAERYTLSWNILVMKGFLYEQIEAVRISRLRDANDEDVQAAAKRMCVEEQFHEDFWRIWLERTARISADGHSRMQGALTELWGEALEALCQPFQAEAVAALGLSGCAPETLTDDWLEKVKPVCEGLRLKVPAGASARTGQKTDQGQPGDDRLRILGEMREVYQIAPGPNW
jgi:ring-1,2-phenylacetyl-CoA epoxidase subunit PaaC